MRKIAIILILLLTSVYSFGQGEKPVNPKVDSLYLNNPRLWAHAMKGSFEDTKLMYETYELNQRVYEYQDKQVKGMVIGAGVMALGTAGWVYAAGVMDPPIYQTSNPGLNEESDKNKRNRRIVAWTSTAVFVTGATVFYLSFKNWKNLRAEVGVNQLKLEYSLFGNRRYYNGKKAPKQLRNRGYYPR